MVRRVLAIVVLLAIAALLLVPAGAMAADGVRATLDGRPISLEKAGQLSCHDFDFPMLTCYRTSDELLEAIDQRAHPVEGATSALAVTSGYVVVFQHGAYAGAAQSISQNYSYLGDIGWNDKISSLKSYGATGKFYEHAPSGGLIYYFYSTSQVTYVGDLYNDKFSSIYFS